MSKRPAKQYISGLTALLMFAVFAVCVLSVLLTGAGSYRRLAQRDDDSYTRRSAAQYISTKVRQAQTADLLTVEELDGVSTLTLRQDLGGIALLTQIYCHDGYLRELYHLEGSGLSPADGEIILPMTSMTVDRQNDLLQITLTGTDGASQRLFLSLHRGKGDAS